MVSSTPRPHFTLRKDPVPILQEAGWAPGPVWTGGKFRPHWDSIPGRPARSQSLYRLSYRVHRIFSILGDDSVGIVYMYNIEESGGSSLLQDTVRNFRGITERNYEKLS